MQAQAGHQHGQQQPEGDEQQQRAQPAQLVVVEAGGQAEGHQADGHPHGFTDQDGPG